MVVIPSEILVRLQGRPLDALMQWTLGGGTLTVSVTREEDLRTTTLTTLLGGEARMTSAAASTTSTFVGATLRRGDVSKLGDDGNYAAYGLGEVWLLRRDPWARTLDPLSAKSMNALYHRGHARRASMLSSPAGNGLHWSDDERVRKLLDPNHGFRPALGIAALLVVIYAFLVGPLAFSRARKLSRPLSVLSLTPMLAVSLFVILVGIGKIGKGFRGRVRKLAVIDVAGGFRRGTATTFHAFFVSDPSAIELVSPHPVDTVHSVEPFVDNAPIDIDRAGVTVRNIRAHPFQTTVIAEEGVRDLGGKLVLEGNGSRLTLINDTAFTLQHVILHPQTTASSPAKSRYFARVKPGETVVARDGLAVDRRIRPVAMGWVSPSDQSLLGSELAQGDAVDAVEALIASWSSASYPSPSPLPFQEPMATAFVDSSASGVSGLSSTGASREAGFHVEREVLFLRVVGLGGGKGQGALETDRVRGKEGEL
ncbi:MAG: hypothetical protein NVS3B20_18480 [Polyangiales bacterium]